MTDRLYWHVPGAKAWHAENTASGHRVTSHLGLCGRTDAILEGSYFVADIATLVPPTAHLCGNCARIIASQTDAR